MSGENITEQYETDIKDTANSMYSASMDTVSTLSDATCEQTIERLLSLSSDRGNHVSLPARHDAVPECAGKGAG